MKNSVSTSAKKETFWAYVSDAKNPSDYSRDQFGKAYVLGWDESNFLINFASKNRCEFVSIPLSAIGVKGAVNELKIVSAIRSEFIAFRLNDFLG